MSNRRVVLMIFDLISPLPAEECVRRLRAKTAEGWSSTIIGSVGETSFRLRKRIPYRNSFQYSLYGKILAENGQTRLRCKAALHPFVLAFFVFWCGVVLIGCGSVVVKAIDLVLDGRAALLAQWGPGAAVPFGMLGLGVTLFAVGKSFARDEPAFLIDFVRQTIDARES